MGNEYWPDVIASSGSLGLGNLSSGLGGISMGMPSMPQQANNMLTQSVKTKNNVIPVMTGQNSYRTVNEQDYVNMLSQSVETKNNQELLAQMQNAQQAGTIAQMQLIN